MSTFKTTDGIEVELGNSDAAHPPMPPGETWGGMNLNTGATWLRIPGEEWIRCQKRSMICARNTIETNTLKDLKELLA